MKAGGAPVVLVSKHEEALCLAGDQLAQALVDAGVAGPRLLENHGSDYHISHGCMLQQVHLKGQGREAMEADGQAGAG